MSKINDLFVAESEKYISKLLTEKLPHNIIYHHFDHTLMVKGFAETIGKQAGLNENEMNILRLCALFLNTGYLNSYENHMEEALEITASYLTEKQVDQQIIDTISRIIRSTHIPQQPEDRISEVLCDAVMMYITAEDGIEQVDLIYDELILQNFKPVKRNSFEKRWIKDLSDHTYYTEYGKTVLQPKKELAIRKLSDRLKRRKWMEKSTDDMDKKGLAYSRGVETMFRITARNQINLNSIADNKSNILISVNAIIISIIITFLVGNIRNISNDIVPVLVLLLICLVTIIIAILSTRPNIVTSKFTREDVKKKKVDLIFFGDFIKLDFDDYLAAVKEMIKDEEHLYSTLTRNQYALGKILAKKFRLVKIAYNVFMSGIILTVIVFLLNFYFTNKPG